VLLLSFIMLYQRRIGAVINALAVQGALLAAAAAWQGWVQGAPGLYVTAIIAFGAKAVAIPLALRLLVGRLGQHRAVETGPGIGGSLLAAIGLVGLAVLVVLLGMLAMIARRNAVSQVIGLLSLENGLILAAVGVVGMPLVVELSTAALVLMVALVAAVVVFQIRERLDTLDTSILDRHGGDS